jgi:hypothetical protein
LNDQSIIRIFVNFSIVEQINGLINTFGSFGNQLLKWYVDAVELSIAAMCLQKKIALSKAKANGFQNEEVPFYIFYLKIEN